MPSRDDVIEAARAMVGFPFVHRGRGPDGIDCVGLIIAVGRRLNIGLDWPEMPYKAFPPEDYVRAVLRTYLDPLGGEPEPGDVALIRWRRSANHLAIVADGERPYTLIHAYHLLNRVVEHRADAYWCDRIVGLYGFRGVG